MHCEVDALLGCGTYFGVINRKVAEGSQQVGVELDLAFSENVSSAWDVLKKRPRICLIVVGENSKTIFDDWKKSAILKAMLKLLNCRFIFTDDQQTNAQIKKKVENIVKHVLSQTKGVTSKESEVSKQNESILLVPKPVEISSVAASAIK